MIYSNTAIGGQGFIGDSNLEVKGDYWEFKNRENIVNITGNIKATSPDFRLFCENLTVLYQNEPTSSQTTDTFTQKVKEVHAEKDVIIDLNNGYTAFANKAEYNKNLRQIILTGNASIRSDKNQVKGCIINYHLDTGGYEIESCPEERAGGKL